MKITNETVLQSQAKVFMDGAGGYYKQEHAIFIDGKSSDIIMVIEGRTRTNDSTRTFVVGKHSFTDMKEAFEYAGYEWLKTEDK